MITIKTVERFLKAFDEAASNDPARPCLKSLHVLSKHTGESEDEEISRLVATDGHILAIADVPTSLLDFACNSLMLSKRVSDTGETCYLTPKKTGIPESSLFPYPDVTNVIHKDLIPATKNTDKAFDVKNIEKSIKIREAYNDCKKNTYIHFTPNYVSAENTPISGEYRISNGLLILIMPIHTQFTMPQLREDIHPINDYLPGFFQNVEKQEATPC